MDARTPKDMLNTPVPATKPSDEGAPALVIQVQSQVGANRSMSMQFAIPLNMTLPDVNAYVNKVMMITDHQNDRGLLEQARLSLESARKNLVTAREQRMSYENDMRLNWATSGRHGDFRMSGAQEKQAGNYDVSIKDLLEVKIPYFEKMVAELEAKIAEGTRSKGD